MSRPWRRGLTLILAWVACATAFAAAPASAAESTLPTAQAAAYGAEWVPFLDPPTKPTAICLVDSGVNVTPDTPADSPNGPILERTALDGGTGEAAGSSWEELHGTRMAMAAAAPINDWGTVGFAPGVRIVSVRAMPRGETTFPFDDYRRAVNSCAKEVSRLNIVAVNLSLGCNCSYSANELDLLESEIAEAHRRQLSVVASAGNNGSTVGSPATASGVLAVGASDQEGSLCPFSNRGPDLDLAGPGCGMDLADSSSGDPWSSYVGGTSAAAVQVAATIGLLRSYRPDMSWSQAEKSVVSGARDGLGNPVLDVEGVFRIVGLGHLVDKARAAIPAESVGHIEPNRSVGKLAVPAPQWGIALDAGTTDDDLPAPIVRHVRWRHGRLRMTVSNRPVGARVVVSAQIRLNEFGYRTTARTARHTDRLTWRVRRRPHQVALRFIHGRRHQVSSATTFRRVR